MSEYWEERMASSQARITDKSVRAIRAQQKNTMRRLWREP